MHVCSHGCASMCTHVHVDTSVYVYAHMFVWFMCMAMHVHIGTHLFASMLIWVHVQICVRACRSKTTPVGDVAQELSILFFEMGLSQAWAHPFG